MDFISSTNNSEVNSIERDLLARNVQGGNISNKHCTGEIGVGMKRLKVKFGPLF